MNLFKRTIFTTFALLLLLSVCSIINVFAATYSWPVSTSYPITSGFYAYTNHNGVDFSCPIGTPVYAVASGTVTTAVDRGCLGSHRSGGTPQCSKGSSCAAWHNNGNNGSFGNYVYITHNDGTVTRYCHLSTGLPVHTGQTVKQGQLIGYSGAAGNTTGPHLHFELRIGGSAYNPANYLTKVNVNPEPPSNVSVSRNQVWYDIKDTIVVYVHADGATSYYMSMFKDGQKIAGQNVDSGTYSLSASTYGIGTYSVYFSCSNGSKSIDSPWMEFSVVGEAGYADVYVTKPVYDIDETVSITVETVCAKGQVIGVDKDGVGRIITENCDTTFTVPASSLGIGTYSAYFSVYNGSGGIDTKRVYFTIAERKNLGDEFCAKIENPSSGKFLTAVDNNVEGVDENCDKHQVWFFYRLSDNSYKIRNYYDWRALDVDNYAAGGAGANVQVYNDWDVTAQRFYIYEVYGAYYIKPVCTDMVLDLSQTTYNLEVWGMGADWPAQKFNIHKINQSDIGVHKYENKIVTDTKTGEQYNEYTCLICNDSYREIIEPITINGDANDDSIVNMKDIVLLQQYLNNWDVEISTEASDVNDDGHINMKDIVLMQQYLNGWNVELK